jgi:hypothetical protein
LVLRKLKEKISKVNNEVNKLLLIGNGVLGKEIYKILKEKYLISIFDSLPEKTMIQANEFKKKYQNLILL